MPVFKIQIMERLIAECIDFEEFVGRSDAVYKSTRGATTDQKLKRKVLCIGLILTWAKNRPLRKLDF